MGLDKFPCMDDLVRNMAGGSRTSGWDVMVNYKIDRLNELLKKVWDNKSNSDRPLEFTVPNYDMRGGKKVKHKELTWKINLAPPEMRFAARGAVLHMKLSGKVWTQFFRGREPGKEEKDGEPEENDLTEGWVLSVVTTMSALTASADGEIATIKPQGTVLDFSGDPSHHGHIVFDCALPNTDTYSLNFLWTGEGKAPEVVPAENLAEARNWIKDNIKAIDFSVGSVTQAKPTKGMTYLTPAKMAFKLVSQPANEPNKDDSLACLSVYIKAKESKGNDGLGDPEPSFGGRVYPIPENHSASIIISKALVWDRLLLQSIRDCVSRSNTTGFNDVKDQSHDEKTGLKALLTYNTTFPWEHANDGMGNYFNHGESPEMFYAGSASEDLVDYLSRHTGAELTISDDGKMTFKSNLEGVRIRAVNYVVWIKTTGSSVYRARTPERPKDVMTWTSEEITASFELKAGDWTSSSGGDENLRGDMWENHHRWLHNIKWPSFEASLMLNFFATTNVFAPGKHFIKIDKSAGIRVPTDFLLVGDVVKPDEV